MKSLGVWNTHVRPFRANLAGTARRASRHSYADLAGENSVPVADALEARQYPRFAALALKQPDLRSALLNHLEVEFRIEVCARHNDFAAVHHE